MKTDIDTDWIIPSSHHRPSVATTTTGSGRLLTFTGGEKRFGLLKFGNLFRILFWEEKEVRRKVAGPGQCKKWCGKGSVAPSYIFLMTDGDNEHFFPSPRIWVLQLQYSIMLCNKQERLRSRAAGQESSFTVSLFHMEENYDNVVGVLCCYKARPGPWWNNPMLDNLLVTPVIFIKTGCGSVNWRCWLRGSCECYGRNISWDAAASCLPSLPPSLPLPLSLLSSHGTSDLARLGCCKSRNLRRTDREGVCIVKVDISVM